MKPLFKAEEGCVAEAATSCLAQTWGYSAHPLHFKTTELVREQVHQLSLPQHHPVPLDSAIQFLPSFILQFLRFSHWFCEFFI